MKILKFGGTSLATAARMEDVAAIVASEAKAAPVTVVVSAMGGVTNDLVRAAHLAASGEGGALEVVDRLKERHLEAIDSLTGETGGGDSLVERFDELLSDLRDLLHGIELLGEASPRSQDRILACGELMSAPLVALALRRAGVEAADVDARELIVTDSTFGSARPDLAQTETRARERIDGSIVSVVTGFIAATPAGETTTLGRGGSDFTAAILGSCLEAAAVELWTDVDGVMSADPRIVPLATPLDSLRYDELMELSHFGAKVVHPPSVHPIRSRGIPLWIKNTFNPAARGTLVTDGGDPGAGESPVRSVASIHRVALLRLEGDGMVGVPGTAQRLFGSLAREGASVILISQASSEHSICFAVAPEDVDASVRAVESEFEIDRRAGIIDELVVEDDVSIVAAVGAAMREHPGIAGRLFGILGEQGINVRAIAQGSSELNISLVVGAEDEARAINAIHEAFFVREPRTARLYLAGVGGVGATLLRQLAEQSEELEEQLGWRLQLQGVANSRGRVVDPGGIDPRQALDRLVAEAEPDGLGGMADGILDGRWDGRSPARIFIDCTASESTGRLYDRFLKEGVTVVTANKRRLTEELRSYRELMESRPGRFYYETTVGAGLPVIQTLEDLLATGDELVRMEGVLSGTASFLVNQLADGVAFSQAVRHANDLGYTEPDPRDDLTGEDVARKLLILARLAGAQIQRSELRVEPLLPASPWMEMELSEFWQRLPEADAAFQRRRDEAHARGCRLGYVASWQRSKQGSDSGPAAGVGLAEVAADHPCYQLEAGENLIAFFTRRYHDIPLVVRGPGAGPDVTAAGVFADILRAIAEQERLP